MRNFQNFFSKIEQSLRFFFFQVGHFSSFLNHRRFRVILIFKPVRVSSQFKFQASSSFDPLDASSQFEFQTNWLTNWAPNQKSRTNLATTWDVFFVFFFRRNMILVACKWSSHIQLNYIVEFNSELKHPTIFVNVFNLIARHKIKNHVNTYSQCRLSNLPTNPSRAKKKKQTNWISSFGLMAQQHMNYDRNGVAVGTMGKKQTYINLVKQLFMEWTTNCAWHSKAVCLLHSMKIQRNFHLVFIAT